MFSLSNWVRWMNGNSCSKTANRRVVFGRFLYNLGAISCYLLLYYNRNWRSRNYHISQLHYSILAIESFCASIRILKLFELWMCITNPLIFSRYRLISLYCKNEQHCKTFSIYRVIFRCLIAVKKCTFTDSL